MRDVLCSRMRNSSPLKVFALVLLYTVIIQQWNDNMQRPQMFTTMVPVDGTHIMIVREAGPSAVQPDIQAPVHHAEGPQSRRRGGQHRKLKPSLRKSSSSQRRRPLDSRRRIHGGHRRRQDEEPTPSPSPTSLFFHKDDIIDYNGQRRRHVIASLPSRAPTPGGRSSASKPSRAPPRAASSFVDDMAAVSGPSDDDDEDFENMSDVDSEGNILGFIDDNSDAEPSADAHGDSP